MPGTSRAGSPQPHWAPTGIAVVKDSASATLSEGSVVQEIAPLAVALSGAGRSGGRGPS